MWEREKIKSLSYGKMWEREPKQNMGGGSEGNVRMPGRTMARITASCIGGLIAAMVVWPVFAQTPGPPAELTALERQVSLKIAHVRIKGPTNAADLKQLGLAQRAQFDGEKAIASGDYKKAEQDFLRANLLISAIGE